MWSFWSRSTTPAPQSTPEDIRKNIVAVTEFVDKLHANLVASVKTHEETLWKKFLSEVKAHPHFSDFERFVGTPKTEVDLKSPVDFTGIELILTPDFQEQLYPEQVETITITSTEARCLALHAADTLSKDTSDFCPVVVERYRIVAASNWAALPWIKISDAAPDAVPSTATASGVATEEVACDSDDKQEESPAGSSETQEEGQSKDDEPDASTDSSATGATATAEVTGDD